MSAPDTGMDTRTPVTILTGFLGSGKTTLLNEWLRSPDLANAAVIVNEFGEVGIDHNLIAQSNDNTIELSTGCLCCTVRGDLVVTLRDLHEQRARGEVRKFDRLLIETTGLADPTPVIQALMTFPVTSRFRLRQVIATVDGVHGMGTLEKHPEALKQAAVADDLIITKSDLPASDVTGISARLKAMNPAARIQSSSPAQTVSAKILDTADVYDPGTKASDVVRWLDAEAYSDEHGHHNHHHDVNRHNAEIGSFCFEFDEPLHWEHVSNWLDALVIGHAEDLLRVKGILNIVGRDRPIVVHAVQSLFHPPVQLQAWPDDDRRSKLVFITRNLTRAFVDEVFHTVRQRKIA
jgi:G3E family GTPase